LAGSGVKKAYMIWWKKPAGKRPLGRPTLLWEDDTKTGLKDIRREVVNWIHPVYNRDRRRVI
jgi:hypothetical protein